MGYNTYGQKSKSFGVPVQVWLEVNGVKSGGGTVAGFENLPVGAVIPAGTPVYLDKSGGELTPVFFYELAKTLDTTDTEAILTGVNLPATGNLIVVPAAIGGTGTGVAYTGAVDNGDGTFTVTIEANALGAATAGTVYAVADKAGTGAVVENTAVPNGLLRHDIVKEDGDDLATGACVDVGRIREDLIVKIPAAYKAVLSDIKFEKGV